MKLARSAVAIATALGFLLGSTAFRAAAADLTLDGGMYACPPLTDVPFVELDGGMVYGPKQNLAHIVCERAEAFIYAQNKQPELIPAPGLVLSGTAVLIVGVVAYFVGHNQGAKGH